jgi:hypothetical protein
MSTTLVPPTPAEPASDAVTTHPLTTLALFAASAAAPRGAFPLRGAVGAPAGVRPSGG